MRGKAYLESTGKGVEQDGKEKKSTTGVETTRVVLQLEEDTADDQGHDEVTDQLRQGQAGISLQALEASDHAQTDLLVD